MDEQAFDEQPQEYVRPPTSSNTPGERGPKRTPLEHQQNMADIAKWYMRGESQYQIGQRLGLSQQMVSYDLKLLRDQWLKSALTDFNSQRSVSLGKIDELEVTYWNAWEASRRTKSISQTKRLKKRIQEQRSAISGRSEATEDDGASSITEEASVRKEDQVGNPAFLSGVQWCIDRRITLLGLDAPKKIDMTVKTEAERLAKQLGLNPEDVLAEAERIMSGGG